MPATRAKHPERGEAQDLLERWWEEHSELDQLVAELRRSLAFHGSARVSQAMEEFAAELESHLSVEEEVYFPLIEQLLPDQAGGTRRARLAHVELRGDLEKMRAQIEEGDLDQARRTFEALLRRFRDHEHQEAKLIPRQPGAAGGRQNQETRK